MPRAQRQEPSKACGRCMRRSWLVAELGAALDYVYSDRSRMLALLALADGDLIDALAGRRRRELHERYAHFSRACPLHRGTR